MKKCLNPAGCPMHIGSINLAGLLVSLTEAYITKYDVYRTFCYSIIKYTNSTPTYLKSGGLTKVCYWLSMYDLPTSNI